MRVTDRLVADRVRGRLAGPDLSPAKEHALIARERGFDIIALPVFPLLEEEVLADFLTPEHFSRHILQRRY